MERAGIVLQRLNLVYNPTAPELLDAHNIYFQTMFELAQQDPGNDSMKSLEKWFAANIQDKGIVPNAQTFATLLRASMNFLSGDEQEEAIRKYLAMAAEIGPQVVEDINSSPDFTDEEWDVLIRAQPEEFEEPPPVQQVQDSLVNTPAARKNLVDHGLIAGAVPVITPVPQKGLGLDTLQQALNSFHDADTVPYPHDMEGTQEEKDRAFAFARQLRIEKDAMDAAVERWKKEDEKLQEMGIHGVMKSKSVQGLMYTWYTALVPLFKKEIEHAKKVLATHTRESQHDPASAYGPWLIQCKPEKLAAITVSRVVLCSIRGKDEEQFSYKVSGMSMGIGQDIVDYLNVNAKLRAQTFLKKQREQLRKDLVDQLARNKEERPSQRIVQPRITPEKIQIPQAIRVKLGAVAIELMLQAAKISVTAKDPKTGKEVSMAQAAFQHQIGYSSGKRTGYVTPHHLFLEKLRNEPVKGVHAVRLPMVVEPKPWSSFDDGGYYTISSSVVRQKTGDPAQRQYAQSAIENGDMKKVLAGLDVLGKVPWQINLPVLQVMSDAWNNGEAIAGLIAEDMGLEAPEEPPADASFIDRAKWGKDMQQYENAKGGYHSARCFQNFQLETARAFAKEKKIFFPHSVDFRGRAYPIPPLLNHIGSDIPRGLLKFANGKELGAVGLQWLKVHLANLYGFDKASLRDREQFAMDNMDEIYDSATKPLEGRRWWLKAEDPWQCLACCIELKNALDSPDPTRFVSQLPVHQDGTCNGLQHYAALGGDYAGARQVNLEPSDRPQDIYTGVAELVQEMVAEDAKKGHNLAEFMNGRITRKVVKRTVMTNVYGVTFIGARAQVLDELKAMFPNFKESETVRSLNTVALYIALKIFEALGKIFNGAQEIQYWLGECGDRITTSLTSEQIKSIQQTHEGKALTYDPRYKAPKKIPSKDKARFAKYAEGFRSSIIWTTPLQMPIVQPYRKDSNEIIQTGIQAISVKKKTSVDLVDKRKQLQAFPPNFIHSLDATHMLLSALKCSEMGLDFAAVHDSFWTHAADIPNLNVILRDAFVRMHSEDIVARLAEEFKARFNGSLYLADILPSSKVAQEIRKWRQQFSQERAKAQGRAPATGVKNKNDHATLEEVALEARRLELLASEDPAKVQQGKEMVTPTSIWLEHSDPKALSSFRLNLLGETKKEKGTSKFDEVRDKVLNSEAEAIAESKSDDAATVSDPTAEEDITAEDAEPEHDTPKRSQARIKAVTAWLPLTFPPIPKKGGWDVSRLRESKYFFS